MELDVDRYRVNFEYIYLLTKDLTEDERLKFISSLSAATHCPILAVAVYLAEMYGWTPKVTELVDRLKRFYFINTITGIRRPREE